MSSINGINGNGWDLNQLGSYNPISQQGSNLEQRTKTTSGAGTL